MRHKTSTNPPKLPVTDLLGLLGLFSLFTMGVSLAASASTLGGDTFERAATRLNGKIEVDGVLDDAPWRSVAPLAEFIQFEPRRGESASEKTEALLLYDDQFLYVGFRCFDSDSASITARQNERDSNLLNDDAVLVVLDTFHDGRSGYYFATNLLAAQLDGRVTDNGRVVEKAWDATWLSAAARFDGGWSAEIAIPLAQLRFRNGSNEVWGLNLGRTHRRSLETSFWAGPLDDRFRISQYGTLTNLQLDSADRKFRIVPYTLGRFQDRVPSDYELGVDLRYTLSHENILHATLNPDFAILEADQEEVNLTRFELALPEKRPFFLEGAESYRQRIRTFYSRRIGDIDFGANVVGRRGGWQYSMFTARSDPTLTSASLLSETSAVSANYTVARAERDLWTGSTLGMMASNRLLESSSQGSVGLDTSLFFTETLRFTGQLIRSHGPEQGGRWAFFIRPARDTSTSHVHLRYTHLGDAFADHVNAIGFIRDDDRRELDSAAEKQFWFEEGPLEHLEYGSNYNLYWSQKGVLRSWQIDQSIEADFRNRWSTEVSFSEEFKLFEKEFRNRRTRVQLGYNTREWQSVEAGYEVGRNFDADFRLLGVSFRRKPTNALSFEYELLRLSLNPDPEQESTYIHVFRIVQNFTPDLFLRVFYQTNSAIDRRNAQAVFVWRYRPPFGTVQLAFERGTAAFGERSEQGNTLFVKFSYVFGQ